VQAHRLQSLRRAALPKMKPPSQRRPMVFIAETPTEILARKTRGDGKEFSSEGPRW